MIVRIILAFLVGHSLGKAMFGHDTSEQIKHLALLVFFGILYATIIICQKIG
jgi:hypothetical protein